MTMEDTAKPFYDTLAAARRLTEAGMPEPHAEAVVREQVHVIEHNLATKADIEQLRLENKTEFESVRGEIEKLRVGTKVEFETLRRGTKANIESVRGEIEKLRLETKADTEKLRLETKADTEKLRLETKAEFKSVRGEIEKLGLQTKADIEASKNDVIKWVASINTATTVGVAAVVIAAVKLL